jgi:hypothetical protein
MAITARLILCSTVPLNIPNALVETLFLSNPRRNENAGSGISTTNGGKIVEA